MGKPKVEVLWATKSEGGTLVKIDGVVVPCLKNVELLHDAGSFPVLRLDIHVSLTDFSIETSENGGLPRSE